MKQLIYVALFAGLFGCQSPEDETSSNSNDPNLNQSQQQNFDDSVVDVIYNANIYTVDKGQAKVEALAYQNDRIVAIGKLQTILEKFPNAKQNNLRGATVVPGFIDAHGHLLGLGQSLIIADLMGTTSKQDIIQILKDKANTLSDGQWLLGRGWDQNDWPEQVLPTAADLDQAFPDRPVWLERVDGHANWANSVAMKVAQKDLSGDWQPNGGEIVRDAQQNASGVFIDNAVNIIQSQVPEASEEELIQAIELAMKKAAEVGLTGMHDAGTSLKVWQLLESANQSKPLSLRVYAMADGAQAMLDHLCEQGAKIDDQAVLTARSVKLYSDGALGSRGAALLAEYSDAPGNLGLLIESEETLKKHASRAANCGLQVNIHAIGDRGNQVTLNVLEQASASNNNRNQNPGRHRIEHSQVVAKADFKRFKDLNLIASVQPTHATSDMYWAQDRVGAERIKGAYAWQTFIDLGIPLALGSDFPVERPDPLLGFYAAVSRQDTKGWPANGWYSSQKLSREQALYGFTLGAAYAAFQEQQLGSLEVGKFADFVVLSKDIMEIPVSNIPETQVLATYVNGKAVFQR